MNSIEEIERQFARMVGDILPSNVYNDPLENLCERHTDASEKKDIDKDWPRARKVLMGVCKEALTKTKEEQICQR